MFFSDLHCVVAKSFIVHVEVCFQEEDGTKLLGEPNADSFAELFGGGSADCGEDAHLPAGTLPPMTTGT